MGPQLFCSLPISTPDVFISKASTTFFTIQACLEFHSSFGYPSSHPSIRSDAGLYDIISKRPNIGRENMIDLIRHDLSRLFLAHEQFESGCYIL